MNQQEKIKLIADKILDWEFIDRLHWNYRSGPYKGDEAKDGSPLDPYTSTADFVEVVMALSKPVRENLTKAIYNKHEETDPLYFIDLMEWWFGNKPKVMDALVEIIEQESKGGE